MKVYALGDKYSMPLLKDRALRKSRATVGPVGHPLDLMAAVQEAYRSYFSCHVKIVQLCQVAKVFLIGNVPPLRGMCLW